jgi:hypothetical protein
MCPEFMMKFYAGETDIRTKKCSSVASAGSRMPRDDIGGQCAIELGYP